jgi:hypothetical protein
MKRCIRGTAARHGLDYDAEQENFEQADERETGFWGPIKSQDEGEDDEGDGMA